MIRKLAKRIGLVRLGTILWLTTIGMILAGLTLTVENSASIGNLAFPDDYFAIIMPLVNSSVGFLIVRFQPRLVIGWMFMALGVPLAVGYLAQSYAIYGLIAEPASGLPGLVLAAWLQQWLPYLAFPIPFSMLFMLFPNGRLPSPKWRWMFGMALAILIVQVFQSMLSPGRIMVYIAGRELALPVLNPTGTRELDFLLPVFDLTWLISILIILVGAVSLVVRYRTAGWAERQQLKWLVYFIILFFILLPVSFLGFGGVTILGGIAFIFMILMLPAGTTIAILRYNLYGIDVIIRRTVQYTLLTGILAVVYFGIVLVLQTLFTGLSSEQSPLVLVISTLTIAALFNPLRLRILAFIDRRFFRSNYDAEKVLSDFGAALRSEVDLDHLSADLLTIVFATMRPVNASLWVKKPGDGQTRILKDARARRMTPEAAQSPAL